MSSKLLHCDNQSPGLLRRDRNERAVPHENVALCMHSESLSLLGSTCGIFTLRNRTPNVFGIPAPYCQRVGFVLLECHRFCILCFPYVFTGRYRWVLTSQILPNRTLCYPHDNNHAFESSYEWSVCVFFLQNLNQGFVASWRIVLGLICEVLIYSLQTQVHSTSFFNFFFLPKVAHRERGAAGVQRRR